MKIPKDLVAASAVPLVLSILRRGASYGYAIIQQVRDLSGGELEWSEGMLYPVLHRLEDQGLVSSFSGIGETGRPRKYYKLTPAGKKALAEERDRWSIVHSTLTRAWKAETS